MAHQHRRVDDRFLVFFMGTGTISALCHDAAPTVMLWVGVGSLIGLLGTIFYQIFSQDDDSNTMEVEDDGDKG